MTPRYFAKLNEAANQLRCRVSRVPSLRASAASKATSPAILSMAPVRVGFCHCEPAKLAKQSYPLSLPRRLLKWVSSPGSWERLLRPLAGPRNDTNLPTPAATAAPRPDPTLPAPAGPPPARAAGSPGSDTRPKSDPASDPPAHPPAPGVTPLRRGVPSTVPSPPARLPSSVLDQSRLKETSRSVASTVAPAAARPAASYNVVATARRLGPRAPVGPITRAAARVIPLPYLSPRAGRPAWQTEPASSPG